jgi:hypothetical protein
MDAEHTVSCNVAMADDSSVVASLQGEQVQGFLLPAAVPFTETDNAGVVRLAVSRPSASPVVVPISMIWILIHRRSAAGWTGPSTITF